MARFAIIALFSMIPFMANAQGLRASRDLQSSYNTFKCQQDETGIMQVLSGTNPMNPGPYGKCHIHVYGNGTHYYHCDHSAQYVGTSIDFYADMTGGNPNWPTLAPRTLAMCQDASDGSKYCVELEYSSGGMNTHNSDVNGCRTYKDGKQCGPCSTNCNNGNNKQAGVKVDVNCGMLSRSGHIFDGTLFNQIR